MSESIYPPSSQELARKRRELAPTIQSAFDAFSKSVFAEGALPAKTKQVNCCRGCSHHAVPILHQGSYQSRNEARSKSSGNHGGDLGRRRDASWRGLRPFGDIAHRYDRGPAVTRKLNASTWNAESGEGETKCNRELSTLRSHLQAWPPCSV
jgi:hypothetical protein